MRVILLIALLFGLRGVASAGPRLSGGSDSTESRGLSVSLVYFTASPGNHGAFLQWRVSQTEQLQYFVIERSSDRKNFKPLAVVNAKSDQLVYFYKDEQVLGNRRDAFYRVRLVGATGAAASPVNRLRMVE